MGPYVPLADSSPTKLPFTLGSSTHLPSLSLILARLPLAMGPDVCLSSPPVHLAFVDRMF